MLLIWSFLLNNLNRWIFYCSCSGICLSCFNGWSHRIHVRIFLKARRTIFRLFLNRIFFGKILLPTRNELTLFILLKLLNLVILLLYVVLVDRCRLLILKIPVVILNRHRLGLVVVELRICGVWILGHLLMKSRMLGLSSTQSWNGRLIHHLLLEKVHLVISLKRLLLLRWRDKICIHRERFSIPCRQIVVHILRNILHSIWRISAVQGFWKEQIMEGF